MYLVLDSKQTGQPAGNFVVNFDKGIQLDGEYRLALSRANLWYSWHNISINFGNNTLRYFNGSDYRDVVFENGQYSVFDIRDYIHSVMVANGDFTVVNGEEVFDIDIIPVFPINRIQINLSNGYRLDLSSGLMHYLLGAEQIEYTASAIFPDIARITNDINQLWIRCDLVRGGSSYLNGETSDIIYTFVPNTRPNSNIDLNPVTLAWADVNVINQKIRSIRITVTDNLGRVIDFNGEPSNFTLLLEKKD